MPFSVKERVNKTKELFKNIPPEQILQHSERLPRLLEGIGNEQKLKGYTVNYYAAVACILACKNNRQKSVHEMIQTINPFSIYFESEKGKEVVLFTWLESYKDNDTTLRLEIPKRKYDKLDSLHANILHFVFYEKPPYSQNEEGKYYYMGAIEAHTLPCEESVVDKNNAGSYSVFPFTKNGETITPIAPVLCFQLDEEE